jgi:hypothetical protein
MIMSNDTLTRSGVTLGKPSDTDPMAAPVPTIFGRNVRFARYLRQWSGPLSSQMRDDLSRNDLRGLDAFFYLSSNDPTPGQ